MTSPKLSFGVASFSEDAVFWLNASKETRDRILKAGGGVPCITDGDRYVAAKRKEAAEAAAAAAKNNAPAGP